MLERYLKVEGNIEKLKEFDEKLFIEKKFNNYRYSFKNVSNSSDEIYFDLDYRAKIYNNRSIEYNIIPIESDIKSNNLVSGIVNLKDEYSQLNITYEWENENELDAGKLENNGDSTIIQYSKRNLLSYRKFTSNTLNKDYEGICLTCALPLEGSELDSICPNCGK